jgi:hypothetical protein
MSTPTLRRSARRSGKDKVVFKDTETQCYPGGTPATDFERMVAKLDSEAYPSARYAAVDDAIVYVFFQKKKETNYYNQLQLQRVGTGAFPTQEEASTIAKMCYGNASRISRNHPTLEECQGVAEEICKLYPNLFEADDVNILRQYVPVQLLWLKDVKW